MNPNYLCPIIILFISFEIGQTMQHIFRTAIRNKQKLLSPSQSSLKNNPIHENLTRMVSSANPSFLHNGVHSNRSSRFLSLVSTNIEIKKVASSILAFKILIYHLINKLINFVFAYSIKYVIIF